MMKSKQVSMEPTVKVAMEVFEPPAGSEGSYRSVIQIQITGANAQACAKVKEAIECAVQMVCAGNDRPAERRH